MKFPTKPRAGEKTLQSLYRSICQIIDYLPSLSVKGNLGGIGVTHTTNGCIINNSNKNVYPDIWHETPVKEIGTGLYYSMFTTTDALGNTVDPKANIDPHVLNVSLSPGEYPIRRRAATYDDGIIKYFYTGQGLKLYWKLKEPEDDDISPRADNQFIGPYIQACYGLYIRTDNKYISGYFDQTDGSSTYGAYKIEWIGPEFPSGWTPGSGGVSYTAGSGISITSGDIINSNIVPGRMMGVWGPVQYNTGHPEDGSYYVISTTLYADTSFGTSQSTAPMHYYNNNQSIVIWNSSWGRDADITGNDTTMIAVYDVSKYISAAQGLVSSTVEIKMKGETGSQIDPPVPGQGYNRVVTQIGIHPTYVADLNTITGRPPNGDVILSSHNGTMSWQQNSGGQGGGGMPWPNYASLGNDSGSMVMLKTRYQAGSYGGWLRISYKGTPVDDCYYVSIGPDGSNDPKVGLWRVGRYAYGNDEIGNTWLLPIPPNNYFYVSFPSNVASAWFDSSVASDSPSLLPTSMINYGDDISRLCGQVRDLKNSANGYMNDCMNESDYYYANEYAQYAESDAMQADQKAAEASSKNDALVNIGITSYSSIIPTINADVEAAQGYAAAARNYAESINPDNQNNE